MTILDRSEWYDIARATNWAPTYVKEEELFPEVMTGGLGVSREGAAREGCRRLFGQGRA